MNITEEERAINAQINQLDDQIFGTPDEAAKREHMMEAHRRWRKDQEKKHPIATGVMWLWFFAIIAPTVLFLYILVKGLAAL